MPDLSNYEFVNDTKLEKIVLAKLKVTLKPELIIRHKKNNKIGAIKFHLTKTKSSQLDEGALAHAATLLKYGLIDSGYDVKLIDDKACFCVDIFAKNYAFSPKAYKRTLDALTDSCKEILDRWDMV